MDPPEPSLTQEEMVARAVALRPKLVADQAETEKRTYYSHEMHEAFLAAGFYHLCGPGGPAPAGRRGRRGSPADAAVRGPAR